MKIGILVIATGRYLGFVAPLVGSIRKYFFADGKTQVAVFVFTDNPTTPPGTICLFKEHKAFPYPTLTRYHTFVEYRKILSKMDYLYYCDADMKFVAKVSTEILSNLVGVLHPGYFDSKPGKFPYERRTSSTAYIKPGDGDHYFCGGFNGGKTAEFLKMARIISQNIDKDLRNNIIAKHHDESHLNKYFLDHRPTVVLSPSYCYPEGEVVPFEPKLIALNKNHATVRYSGARMVLSYIEEKAFNILVHSPITQIKKFLKL